MTRAPAAANEHTAPAVIFLGFAFAYFLSALLRAVTATLAPVFSSELGLSAGHLGLLAGAYFLGFAVMQLPLGAALDRLGPRRVVTALLGLAAIGCAAFAAAANLMQLFAARTLIGVGVAACLMAPLTSYRRLFSQPLQLRANSWMLMTGSLGMVASTVPVQALVPYWGWRGVFWALAGLLVVAIAWILAAVPPDPPPAPAGSSGRWGYIEIARHPAFVRLAPLGFFVYGGMIAVQALWAGPWLTRVSGWTADEAARGLLLINTCMLLAFLGWGIILPRLIRGGIDPLRLIAWGLPPGMLMLVAIVWLGPRAQAWHWAAWCVGATFVTLSQPYVGQVFEVDRAGRALSAFNLVIFAGVFALQSGIGWLIDVISACGFSEIDAFRLAFAVFLTATSAAYLWFVLGLRSVVDNG